MPFNQQVNIDENHSLRIPQRAGLAAIRDHFLQEGAVRDVAVVLPVGCGKSGLIAIAPFALRARRVLVVRLRNGAHFTERICTSHSKPSGSGPLP